MVKEYSCSTCLKDFTQKSQYERHMKRKNPCKAPKVINETIKNIIESNSSFRELSNKLNKELSKEDRKNQGIFFTPKKARDLLFDKLDFTPTNILEPSFGSGEFIEDAMIKFPTSKITGVEFNETIFKSYKNPKVNLIHDDFMNFKSDTQFDCIIGNPPYFVIKDKNPLCMIGRPNIYVAFLYKCLTEHLADKGTLAFILPTSLYNCSYYEPMRKYIYDNCSIKFLETLDQCVKYYETAQDTMLIVIKKEKDRIHKYFYKNYISPFYEELNSLVKGTTTIKEIGLFVKTGDVVWNQEKEKLSDKGVLLIYSTNIVDGTLVIDNINSKEKKQYIKDYHKTPISGKAILVNRGYGNVKYKFNYIYVDLKEFYGENHVNMILPRNKESEKNLDLVKKSFDDPRTFEFIQKFVGNGAMSKTEIETILPIFS